MVQIKNVSDNEYIGADVGSGSVVRIRPGEVGLVTDDMEEYLALTWPADWELMSDDEPEPEPEPEDAEEVEDRAKTLKKKRT